MLTSHKIAIGLVFTVILDTVVQLIWKYAVTVLPATQAMGPMLAAALHQPWFLVLAVVAVSQFINWLVVLEYADLSYAKPIASLSYVTVSVLSLWLFGDHITFLKTLGIILVLVGVWQMCKSAPKISPAK